MLLLELDWGKRADKFDITSGKAKKSREKLDTKAYV